MVMELFLFGIKGEAGEHGFIQQAADTAGWCTLPAVILVLGRVVLCQGEVRCKERVPSVSPKSWPGPAASLKMLLWSSCFSCMSRLGDRGLQQSSGCWNYVAMQPELRKPCLCCDHHKAVAGYCLADLASAVGECATLLGQELYVGLKIFTMLIL